MKRFPTLLPTLTVSGVPKEDGRGKSNMTAIAVEKKRRPPLLIVHALHRIHHGRPLFLVVHKFRTRFGNCFSVRTSGTNDIDDLKWEAKEERVAS